MDELKQIDFKIDPNAHLCNLLINEQDKAGDTVRLVVTLEPPFLAPKVHIETRPKEPRTNFRSKETQAEDFQAAEGSALEFHGYLVSEQQIRTRQALAVERVCEQFGFRWDDEVLKAAKAIPVLDREREEGAGNAGSA